MQVIRQNFFRKLHFRFCGSPSAMVGQTKISSFFTCKPEMGKRKSTELDQGQDFGEPLGAKSFKCMKEIPDEKEEKCCKSDGDTKLTGLARSEINHIRAKIILTSKTSPAMHSNIGLTWFKALEAEFSKEYFLKLSKFLVEERKRHVVYPPEEHVFSWTRMCDIDDVKVVILGQDPYHGPNQAHGLAFSVTEGVPPPPSLVNMYKELKNSIPAFQIPSHGNLTNWANQGVLLLNACLTVKAHAANSHKDMGWEQFTDAVINWISENRKGVVFLLWGAYAQKKASMISKNVHHVLCCPHPSPLSAHKGFLGSQHFVKANDYLKATGKGIIDWTL